MLNLENLSEGDKKNIAYEIAYMAILGPGESSTDPPFKQVVPNPNKEWEQKIVKDHTIPSELAGLTALAAWNWGHYHGRNSKPPEEMCHGSQSRTEHRA